MDQCSLFHHVSSISEVLEDGSQAFYTVHYLFGTTKPVALIDSGWDGQFHLISSSKELGRQGGPAMPEIPVNNGAAA